MPIESILIDGWTRWGDEFGKIDIRVEYTTSGSAAVTLVRVLGPERRQANLIKTLGEGSLG